MPTIDQLSTSSLFIDMRVGDTALASGTGFVWKDGEALFLVTNWHNLSGQNPLNGQSLSPSGSRPDNVVVWLQGKGSLVSWRGVRFELLDRDGTPRWFEHPVLGRRSTSPRCDSVRSPTAASVFR